MARKHAPLEPIHQVEALEPRALFSGYLYTTPDNSIFFQNPLREFAPPGSDDDGFGSVVIGLGDIDGDGVPDVAISAPGAAPSDTNPAGLAGHVFLFSGATGTLIRMLDDSSPEFGAALANLGDINNDGVPDLLIGSPGYDATANDTFDPTGRAYIFSGADGAVLRTFDAVTTNGDFGRVVSRLNDADNDAIPDVIIGAPGRAGADLPGEVFVFSGADGALIRSHTGEHAGDRFGAAIAAAPASGPVQDLFAIGAPGYDGVGVDAGRVYVFNAAGAQAYTLDGAFAGDRFGTSLLITSVRVVAPLSPEDAVRLVVGVPGADNSPLLYQPPLMDMGNIESFRLISGSHRSVAGAIDPTENARFGERLALLPDLDFDGAADVGVLAPGPGRLYAFSAGLRSLNFPNSPYTAPAPSAASHLSLASIGDVNDDGIPDIITGFVAPNGDIRVRLLSSLAIGPTIILDGASDDLRYLWSQSSQLPILFIDGVPRAFDHIPGLSIDNPSGPESPRSVIQAIGNDGTIYFQNLDRAGNFSELMILRDAQAPVTLSSLVTTVEGPAPADYAALRKVRLGNGPVSHLVLTDSSGAVYVYSEGVISFLWIGQAHDVNDSGAVVGTIMSIDLPFQSAIWTPDAGITVIPELEGSLGVNNDGVVVGTRAGTRTPTNAGALATWHSGVVVTLGAASDASNVSASPEWIIADFADDGRVLAAHSFPRLFGETQFVLSLFRPDDGLRPLSEFTHAIPPGTPFGTLGHSGTVSYPHVDRLAANGNILTSNTILTPIDNSEVATLRDNSPIASITVAGVRYVAAVNQYDELILFRYTGDSWSVRRLTSTHLADGASRFLLVADPLSDSPVVVVADGRSLTLYRTDTDSEDPGIGLDYADRLPIVRGLATFTNAEGVVHLAGFAANGDLIIYYRDRNAAITDAGGWVFDNLSQIHLDPQDQATPAIVSHLTTYVTPWSGMNIAGLDENGHVQVVWWAPGMQRWQATDLSTSVTGAPATFVGELSAFVSPWGTMHISGTSDSIGHVFTLWWAPGFGDAWRGTTLSIFAPAFDTLSIASYVSPWGGLNVVGRSTAGEAIVYWWSPQSGEWRTETLPSSDSPLTLAPGGNALSAAVELGATITQHIFARGEDNHLRHLSWQPDGNPWSLEDLTALV